MSQPVRRQAMQIAVLVVTFCAALNVAFYFLSDLYFDDRARRFGESVRTDLSGVRAAFVVFTASIGLASILAALQPRVVGHSIAGLAAVASLLGAGGAFSQDMPIALPVTLVLLALVFPVLIWHSLAGSRAAWSFLIGLCSVYALVMLFGAPKIRGLFGVGFWHAMIIPGLLAIGATALSMQRDHYRERSTR